MHEPTDHVPEIRTDPLTGRRVIVAPERAGRPSDLDRPYAAAVCPFCPGHEGDTPPELLAVPGPDGAGWSVRVVPNKYPALRGDLAPVRPPGPDDCHPGLGGHEVLIESPAHVRCLTDLGEAQTALALAVYRDRLRAQWDDPRLAYGQLFKNVGALAGASLEHTHAQLLVMPQVPPVVAEELHGAAAYHRDRGRCLFCDTLARERHDGRRLVLESPRFVVLAPFASRMPFEMCLLPTEHAGHFEALADADCAELARVLRSALRLLIAAAGRPDYNLVFHTAPLREPARADYHWHVEILPRLTQLAGFEWGTGWTINPLPPEEATALLRAAGQ